MLSQIVEALDFVSFLTETREAKSWRGFIAILDDTYLYQNSISRQFMIYVSFEHLDQNV